ncbi:hypothetical protein PRUPE_2G005900 [Prunus persica]|uniref:uroporphyrinogen-III C-methyltransferase n=1 Tax=Prunus persica TaxID=3760 RepID=A0A251Q8Z3_PRUPE|nr:hypothetical protein PRUPE_2G005900 [Prunus persica]
MALVYKLQSLSSSLSSTHFRKPNSLNPQPICSLHFNSSSNSSPFTEKTSIERYQRDQWLYKNQLDQATLCSVPPDFDSIRQNDIALQLPELRKLLQVLRGKRESEGGCGSGKCGPGNVFLVGTGPGDPELLTLKAYRVIQNADLLLYDRLVSNDVLELVGSGARLLYVGKTAGYHSRTQEEIHELLLSFAEAGANVVRLKGGDPLVFGRGGEEMDFLRQQGIEVNVIPVSDFLPGTPGREEQTLCLLQRMQLTLIQPWWFIWVCRPSPLLLKSWCIMVCHQIHQLLQLSEGPHLNSAWFLQN